MPLNRLIAVNLEVDGVVGESLGIPKLKWLMYTSVEADEGGYETGFLFLLGFLLRVT